MKPSKVALAVSLLANLALGFLLFQQRQQTSQALASVDLLRAATNDLHAGLTELQSTHVSADELERLKADQREAIKLRGDVGNLKKAVVAAEKIAAERGRAVAGKQAAAPEPAPTNPHVRVFNARNTATLPPGHAMMMGGWKATPGKTLYAIISPDVDSANPNAIKVAAKWAEITDESVAKLGGAFRLFEPGQSALLTSDQYGELLGALEKTQGVDLLSAPMVTTGSGRQAAIEVTQRRNTPDGGVADFGPSMNLVPTLDPATGAITVEVDATMTQPSEELAKVYEAELERQNAENRARREENEKK